MAHCASCTDFVFDFPAQTACTSVGDQCACVSVCALTQWEFVVVGVVVGTHKQNPEVH